MPSPGKPTPIWIAVPAAGSGSRMGLDIPKQYLSLAGRTLAEHTLSALLAVPGLQALVVAISPGDRHWHDLPASLRGSVRVIEGGADRAASVLSAVGAFDPAPADTDWVLVHDMARACIRTGDVANLVSSLADDAIGGLLALPVVDTLKRADEDGRVAATVTRDSLWRAQTPQMFRYGLLRHALREAREAGVPVTDEAMAVERLGHRPRLVPCGAHNIKITTPGDLALAEYYLGRGRLEGDA